MFGWRLVKDKVNEVIEAVVTADAFDGFFKDYAAANKDLSIIPVYASIKIISQAIATSPLKLYKKTDKGRKEVTDTQLAKLLKSPHGYMTMYNWLQTQMQAAAGRGNAYAMIQRDINNEPVALVPILWDSVTIFELINSSEFYYQFNYLGNSMQLWAEDVLHFKPYSEDGIRGVNPIELHKRTIDSANNELEYNDTFYKKAVNISGVIESPKQITDKQSKDMTDKLDSKHGGVGNSGKTLLLGDGKTYKQLKLVSPMDAQYVENAKLTRADIGVMFGVPLPLLGDLSQATFGNMGELNRAFHKYTISSFFICATQELNMKLLKESEKDDYYFEFDAELLLSVSTKERYENYASGIRNGHLTRNEVRVKENRETIEGLDEPLQESGVMTVKQANSNFNNNGGENGNSDLDDNSSEDIKAVIKSLNDFKAEFGRMKGQLESSRMVTPKKKVKDEQN